MLPVSPKPMPLLTTTARYWQLVRRHYRFLLLAGLGGCLVGGMVTLWVVPPKYTSQAKMLIKGAQQPDYVVPFQKENEIRALTSTGNPVLTQIEVLNSQRLARQVINALEKTLPPKEMETFKNRFPLYFEPESLVELIKLRSPASTDVIQLALRTPDKALSMHLVNAYTGEYPAFLQEINRQSLQERGRYIQTQIQNTEAELDKTRQALMQYREEHHTVDLEGETQATIRQNAELEHQRVILDTRIAAHQGMFANLRRKLGISTQRGIQSVALGMNAALNNLQKSLDEARQEYQTLSVKYTEENPTMQALRARMSEVQRQIETETTRTLGNKAVSTFVITDPVRSGLVDQLVKVESELQAMQAERKTLMSNMEQLREMTQQLPEKQRELATLIHAETVQAEMVDMLRLKAAEAHIRASDDLSNVVVIEPATLPIRADFPRPVHMVGLFGLLGVLSGLISLLYWEWRRTMLRLALRPDASHSPARPKSYGSQPTPHL